MSNMLKGVQPRELTNTLEDSALFTPVTEEYVSYSRRWLVLLSFSLVSCANAMVWNTFSPLSRLAAEFFDCEAIWIDSLSLVFMVVYILGILPASMLISRYSLMLTVIVGGGLLNTLGAWVRYIGVVVPVSRSGEYWIVMAGQTIASMSQCFILQVPPLISDRWFPVHQRALATSIGALWNQLGIAIGFLMSPVIIKEDSQNIKLLLLVIAIICSVTFLMLCFCFRSAPPTPPAKPNDVVVLAFTPIAKRLCNRSFIALFFSFGINTGVFYAIATLLDMIIGHYLYSSHHTGWFGFSMIVAGLAGAVIGGYLLDLTQKYKELLFGFYGGTALSVVILGIILRPRQDILVGFLCGLIGFFITGILPLSLETAVEVTYPEVPEEYSSGLMMMSAQVFGITFIFILNTFVRHQWILESLILLSSASLVAFLSIVFIVPVYYRLQYVRSST